MSIMTLQGEEQLRQGVRYEVDDSVPPIGRGGMGVVCRGVRIDSSGTRKDAAIKFLFDDLPLEAIDRSRIESSIQIHSENLVEMFGFIEIDGIDAYGNPCKHYHIASELLEGVSLFELIRGKTCAQDGTSFTYAEELYSLYNNDRESFAFLITKNILSGVMSLHDKGYIHRDIDPSNIMITKDRKIKLIDFGIAKKIDKPQGTGRQLTSIGQMIGKYGYGAPELLEGNVSCQNMTSDLYSIGIMLFELITGHLPFEGSAAEVFDMQCKRPIPLDEIHRPDIAKVICKATQKVRSDRYQTAAEFRVDIEHLEKSSTKKQPEPTDPAPNAKEQNEKSLHTPLNNETIVEGSDNRYINNQKTIVVPLVRIPRWAWTCTISGGFILGFVLSLILRQ